MHFKMKTLTLKIRIEEEENGMVWAHHSEDLRVMVNHYGELVLVHPVFKKEENFIHKLLLEAEEKINKHIKS
jgi:hypothetical protein